MRARETTAPVSIPDLADGAGLGESRARLPGWPIAALLGGYPIWWAVGVADVSWIVFGFIMAAYLIARGGVRVPRGFLVWILFLLCVLVSATQLSSFGNFTLFAYRGMHYLAATVTFLYIYNAKKDISDRYIAGSAFALWITTIVGGLLGMILPTTVYRSPLSYVLPEWLLGNDLVNRMVIRRFAQYDPDAWVPLAPRPSAPYLFTNNWGNAYSLLLPLVLIYLFETRGEKRFWWIMATLPISLVPAIATMNRGMFIGIGITIVYFAFRYLLMGRVLIAMCCIAAIALAGIVFVATPLSDQLEERAEGGTNESRATVYEETLRDVEQSPLLGMGSPRQNPNPKLPPVGSHGQFWIVMHSHGVPAMVFFMGWFVMAFLGGVRRRDFVGIAGGGAILLSLVQFTLYGFVPVGMTLLMVSCGLVLRGPEGDGNGEPLVPRQRQSSRL